MNESIIAKTMDVLEVLSEYRDGQSVTEISRKLGLNKSTVYRILSELVEKKYVIKNDVDKRYRMGFRILMLASQVLESVELRKIARPELVRLAEITKETVHLVWLEENEGVYIEKALSIIIEVKFPLAKLEAVLNAIKEVANQVDTVFSVAMITKVEPDGSLPNVQKAIELGFNLRPNPKVNVGLGRPLKP